MRNAHGGRAARTRAESERLLDDQPLSNNPRFQRNLSNSTGFRFAQNRNLMLNDSIMSIRSTNSSQSADGDESSIEEGIERLEGVDYSEVPLENHKNLLPTISIGELLKALYEYLRYGLAGMLLVYSIYLMFNKKEGCNSEISGVKRVPADSSRMGLIQSVTCMKSTTLTSGSSSVRPSYLSLIQCTLASCSISCTASTWFSSKGHLSFGLLQLSTTLKIVSCEA